MRSQYQRARELWNANLLTNYAFVYETTCEDGTKSSPATKVNIVNGAFQHAMDIQSGVVASEAPDVCLTALETPDQTWAATSIDTLFDAIGNALNGTAPARVPFCRYDPTTGAPSACVFHTPFYPGRGEGVQGPTDVDVPPELLTSLAGVPPEAPYLARIPLGAHPEYPLSRNPSGATFKIRMVSPGGSRAPPVQVCKEGPKTVSRVPTAFPLRTDVANRRHLPEKQFCGLYQGQRDLHRRADHLDHQNIYKHRHMRIFPIGLPRSHSRRLFRG